MTISRVCTIGLSLVAACGPGTAAMTDGPATGTATTDSATGDVPTSTAIPTSTAADTTMATMPGSSSASSGPPDPTLPSTTTASTEATTDATDPVSGTASTGTANTGTASTGTEACMFTAGVTTHVIGFGGAIDPAQLEKLADWGSGNQLNARQAADQDQLEMHLAQILDTLDLC